MRNNYCRMKRQLQSLRKENEYLRDDNELMNNMYNTSFEARLKAENDNFNLQELTKLGTSLSIIMSQMLANAMIIQWLAVPINQQSYSSNVPLQKGWDI